MTSSLCAQCKAYHQRVRCGVDGGGVSRMRSVPHMQTGVAERGCHTDAQGEALQAARTLPLSCGPKLPSASGMMRRLHGLLLPVAPRKRFAGLNCSQDLCRGNQRHRIREIDCANGLVGIVQQAAALCENSGPRSASRLHHGQLLRTKRDTPRTCLANDAPSTCCTSAPSHGLRNACKA